MENVSNMSAAPALAPVARVLRLDLKAFVMVLSALATYFLMPII
jgi:hypothetical protein